MKRRGFLGLLAGAAVAAVAAVVLPPKKKVTQSVPHPDLSKEFWERHDRIMERLSKRAMDELHAVEDARMFSLMNKAATIPKPEPSSLYQNRAARRRLVYG